jgi:transposase InsO family protein
MPWREVERVSLREELIQFAGQDGLPFIELCRRFGISRKTGYKWLQRYEEDGLDGLRDLPRTPRSSPSRTDAGVEGLVVALRQAHPVWGARKLQRVLKDTGLEAPSTSTVNAILGRHGLLGQDPAKKPATLRYERDEPNKLWQLDYKGHIALLNVLLRLHPLCVVDDHSRFAVVLKACDNERRETVKEALIGAFRIYGLPLQMTMDNGAPWGTPGPGEGITALEAWLMLLGIRVSHSRPYHPQTQGKVERFNGTLKRELLDRYGFASIDEAQGAFDRWRHEYNYRRPHEACGLATPSTRYQPSLRPYPEKLVLPEYEPGDIVRKVDRAGRADYRGHAYRVGKGLAGLPVAIRPTTEDGVFAIFFCHQEIRCISLKNERLD